MSKRINLQEYAQDKQCATPEGLKAKLLADLGPHLETITLQRNRCLVATYVRPNVTAGGIIIPERNQDEDRWQSTVGLLLLRGPVAFDFEEVQDRAAELDRDGRTQFEARYRAEREFAIPQLGDWVMYRASETYEVGINGVSCRYINDDCIVASITNPAIIW